MIYVTMVCYSWTCTFCLIYPRSSSTRLPLKQPILTAGGSSKQTDSGSLEPQLHPCVDAACELLMPRFSSYCSTKQGQDLFGVPTRLEKILSSLPEDLGLIRETVASDWLNSPSDGVTEVSVRRWNTLRAFLTERGRVNVLKQLVLTYTYPRLDVNVSTSKWLVLF